MPAGAVLWAVNPKDVKASPISNGSRPHSSAGDPSREAVDLKAAAAASLGSMLQSLRSFRRLGAAPAKASGLLRRCRGLSAELPGSELGALEARGAEAPRCSGRHSVAGGCCAAAASEASEAGFWEALEPSEGGGRCLPAAEARSGASRAQVASANFLKLADDIASASSHLSTSLSLRASSLKAHAAAPTYPPPLRPAPRAADPCPLFPGSSSPVRLSSNGGNPPADSPAGPSRAASLTDVPTSPSPGRLSSCGGSPPIKCPAPGPSRAVSFKDQPLSSAAHPHAENPAPSPSRLSSSGSTPSSRSPAAGPSRAASLKALSVPYTDPPHVEAPLPPASSPSTRLSASGGGLPSRSPAAGPSRATALSVNGPTHAAGPDALYAACRATALELLPPVPRPQPLPWSAGPASSPPTTPILPQPPARQSEGGAGAPPLFSACGRRPSFGGSLPRASPARQPSLSGSLPHAMAPEEVSLSGRGVGLAGRAGGSSGGQQRGGGGVDELYWNLWGDEEPALAPPPSSRASTNGISSRASTNGILDSHGELAVPQRGASLRNMMLADCGGAPAAPREGSRRSVDMGSVDRANAVGGPAGSLMAVTSMRKRASMLADMASLPGMPLVGGQGGPAEPDWFAFP